MSFMLNLGLPRLRRARICLNDKSNIRASPWCLFFSMVRLSFQGCADELLSNFIFSCGQMSFVGYGAGDSAAAVDTSL